MILLDPVVTVIVGGTAAVLVIIGVIGLLLPARTLRRVTVSVVTPANAETGLVSVRGTATPDDTTVTAPLSGCECLGYIVTQQLLYRTGQSIDGLHRHYRTEDATSHVTPFTIRGDAAVLPVNVTNITRSWRTPNPDSRWSDVKLPRSTTVTCSPDEPVPDSVAEYFDDAVPDDPARLGSGPVPHRYIEWRLDSGADVSMTGRRDALGDPLRHTIADELLIDTAVSSRSRIAAAAGVRWLLALLLTAIGTVLIVLVT